MHTKVVLVIPRRVNYVTCNLHLSTTFSLYPIIHGSHIQAFTSISFYIFLQLHVHNFKDKLLKKNKVHIYICVLFFKYLEPLFMDAYIILRVLDLDSFYEIRNENTIKNIDEIQNYSIV